MIWGMGIKKKNPDDAEVFGLGNWIVKLLLTKTVEAMRDRRANCDPVQGRQDRACVKVAGEVLEGTQSWGLSLISTVGGGGA